jgi:putative addiction module component (TIGR02574 family)
MLEWRNQEPSMTTETQHILRAAMALPEAERILLVEELLELISPEPEPCTDEQFAAELDRRAAECARNPSIAIALSDLLKDD